MIVVNNQYLVMVVHSNNDIWEIGWYKKIKIITMCNINKVNNKLNHNLFLWALEQVE